MNKITKNYIYNLIYQILVIIVPIFTAPYLARVLGSTNLGVYSYIYSCASIINTVTLLGVHTYGYREIAYNRDNKEKCNKVFWEIIYLRLSLATLGSLAYFLWASFSGYFLEFLLYYPWLLGSFIDFSFIYIGKEEMKSPVLKNILIKVLSVVGIFVIVRTNNDLLRYIMVLSFSMLLGSLTIIPGIFKMVNKDFWKVKTTFKEIFKHLLASIKLFLPQAAVYIYLQLDKIMIKHLSGSVDQVAFYDQADKIVQMPLAIITVLTAVVMPRMANYYKNNNVEGLKTTVKKSFSFSMMLSIPMCIGIAMVSQNFINWYLGSSFIDSANAMIILCPVLIASSLTNVAGSQYLMAVNKTRALLISNISALVLNVALNFVLIPSFGYVGAAIATVSSYFCSAIIQMVFLSKFIKLKELLPNIVNYIVSAVFMLIGLLMVQNRIGSLIQGPVFTLIQVFSGVLIYFGVCYLLKDKFLTEAIAGFLSKRKRGNK